MLPRNYLLHNRYRIIRPLSKGGFGQVYEALDDKLDSIVAIKERRANLDSEKLRRAFEREAKMLANLRHPVLPKVSDHFFEGNGQFLVMEFIEGDDLATLLLKRQRPFTVEQVLAWADELLRALEYLHHRPEQIIHRDIKPGNIKLTNDGEIFLIDFGLAKGSAWMTPEPETGHGNSSLHGYTAAYAPLEQLNNSGTNEQSDIYSLGATLYHLLTGQPPKAASQRYKSLELGERDPLIPAHETAAGVPFPVSLVLLQAMAMNRRDRLSSAGRMRQALNEARLAIKAVEQDRADETETPVEASRDRRQGAQEPTSLGSTVPSPTVASPVVPSPVVTTSQPVQSHLGLEGISPAAHDQPNVAPHDEQAADASWPSQITSEAVDSQRVASKPESEAENDRDSTLLIARPDEPDEAERAAAQRAEEERRAEERRHAAEAEEARVRAEAEAQQRAVEEAERQRAAEQALADEEARRQAAAFEAQQSRQREQQAKDDAEAQLRQQQAAMRRREQQTRAAQTMNLNGARPDNPQPVMPQPAMPQSSSEVQRRARSVWIIGGLLALLAVVTIAAILINRRALTTAATEGDAGSSKPVASSTNPTIAAAPSSFALERKLTGQQGTIWTVAYAPDGGLVAGAGEDGKVRIWDTLAWQLTLVMEGHRDDVNSVAFSPDGRLLASGSTDQTIRIWKVANGASLKTLRGHEGRVLFIAFSPDGRMLASAGADKTVRLWDIEQGREVKTLSDNDDEVWSVAFAPDGETLASADRNQTIGLWDIKKGTRKQILKANGAVFLAFSSDKTTLASGQTDGSIKLWNWKTGQESRAFTAHEGYVASLAFTSDGATLASAGKDKSIKLWDARSGALKQTLNVQESSIESISFSPDGRTLISGGRDQMMRVWQ